MDTNTITAHILTSFRKIASKKFAGTQKSFSSRRQILRVVSVCNPGTRGLNTLRIVQRACQIGVAVGELLVRADGLEFRQSRFAQPALKISIAFAREDPATGKAVFIDGAFAVDIIWTPPGRHSSESLAAKLRRKIRQLRRRNEQTMIESLEIAAFPTSLALPPNPVCLPNPRIEPSINLFDLLNDRIVHLSSLHHFLLFLILSISSQVYSFPRFTPGHFFVALFHAFALARFPGQNGQFRHWLGRTE